VDDFLRQENKISFAKTDYFPAEGLQSAQIPSDAGIVSGIDLVGKCVEILDLYNFQTEVLAASLRNPRQTREAALAGAHIATLPLEVISMLLVHDKTLEGMRLFTQDVVPEYQQLLGQGV
jgi:transaldolase